jgi:hypothetical protein
MLVGVGGWGWSSVVVCGVPSGLGVGVAFRGVGRVYWVG